MNRKKLSIFLFALLFLGLILVKNSLFPRTGNTLAAPPPIPNPMILSYGGFDSGFDPTILNLEGSIPTPNVVESRVSTNSPQEAKEGVRTLVEKGGLPAFHTNALPRVGHTCWWEPVCDGDKPGLNCDELPCARNSTYESPNCGNEEENLRFKDCIDYNVNEWQKAFIDDLDGNLPGGYQAITVDEISLIDKSSITNKIELETLKKVKQNNPDRLIFVWGCCVDTQEGTGLSVGILTYINNYADRMIYEIYYPELTEDKDYYFNLYMSSRIRNLIDICGGKTCAGIPQRTIIGLGTADTEDWAYDNNPSVDFPDYLDDQLHYIKNSSYLRDLPGIAFYSYDRTRPETLAWLNKLTRHYYLNNQTSYFGDGYDSLKFVANSSFEEDGGWNLQPGGGNINYKSLSDVGLTNPGEQPRVPHGSRVLYMKRGSSLNTATDIVSVSGGSFYHLDVYAKKQTSPYEMAHGDVQVVDSAGNSLITFKEKKEVHSNSGVTYSARNHLWTRFRIEFKTPPETSKAEIILSDDQAVGGEVTLWDFVELEELKAGSLIAGVGSLTVSEEHFNLLGNPGFEKKVVGWEQYVADGAVAYAQSSVVHSGSYAAKIQTTGGESRGSFHKSSSYALPATPGEEYTLKSWVKTGNIGYARLILRFYNSDRSWLGKPNDPFYGDYISPNQDWQECSLTGTVPPGAGYIVPMLYAHGGTGEAFFDDVSLVKTSNKVGLLKNPGFEENTFFWLESRAYGNTLNGQVVSNPVKEGTKSLMAQTNVGTDVWKQAIFLQNPLTYKISGWVYLDQMPSDGNAWIYVRADKTTGGFTDFNVFADKSKLNQWQYIEKEFQFGWEYLNRAVFNARTSGSPSKVYFDELKIEEVSSATPTSTPTPTPPPSIPLVQGWNEIVWPNISGKKASDIPDVCPMAVAKENFWFRPYVSNYGGGDFEFINGETYYLKCGQEYIWNL